jgi:hypothetical protein
MLAKLTSKNQITIPKSIINQIPKTDYFEVELKNDMVVLKPVIVYGTDLEKIRSKIKRLGLKRESVNEAIEWARSK